MDPGHSLLQHIKTIPNLINEDPNTVTPENTAFKDIPWSELTSAFQGKGSTTQEVPEKQHQEELTTS
ncbi:hypothetical protein BDF14DRAFT_1222415 [Spinellus fusiger]|nr:hypothetical protein BDF14DRAFT_1222415 [Spinellus fusiger]